MPRLTVLAQGTLALSLLLPAARPPLARGRTAPPAAPYALAAVYFVNSGQGLGGETGQGVAVGDLDGDGDLDALAANDYSAIGPEGNQVWVNQGGSQGGTAGEFEAGPQLGTTNGTAVALGDLDGDSDLDAVIATETSISGQAWINQGGTQGGTEGSFAAGQGLGSFAGYGVALGDVDDDSDLDVLLVGNENRLYLNNGAASFTAQAPLPFLFSEAAVLADLDDDGFVDALIGDSASGTNTRVYWNDGNWNPGPGTFTAGDPLPADLVHGTAVGQIDDDGQPDIFLATSGEELIFWNDGGRDFISTTLPIADSSWAVALGDVNGDSRLDAVVGNISADPNRVWENMGGRVLTVTQTFGDELGLYWSRGLALGDLAGGGELDLFEVTTADDRVWLNATPPAVIPNDPGWQTQALDTRGDAGFGSSLVLDANGHPHLSYGRYFSGPDDSASYVTYTYWDGVRWHTEVVSTDAGGGTALALDAAGNPHLAFESANGSTLYYAVRSGGDWVAQAIESVPFPQTLAVGGLRVDPSGNAHVVYNTFSNASAEPELLKYARRAGGAWQIETIETGLVYDSGLVLDAGGNPRIGYAFREGFDTYVAKYAYRDGTGWHPEIVDGEVADAGVFVTALALEANGNPRLVYSLDQFSGTDIVRQAVWNGSGWTIQPVASLAAGQEVLDVGLDLDSGNRPHVVYFESEQSADGYRVQYQRWDGLGWQATTLARGDETTLFRDQLVSMGLDAGDNLHAGYYEAEYEDLRYVTWAPNWQVRTVSETGSVRSPALGVQRTLEGTLPHLAYYSPSGGQVKLATWDTDWALNPLDFVSSPVEQVSMAAGPQYEHVTYYDADNQRLMYGYWDGASWHPEIVDEAGDVGRYNELLLAGNTDGGARVVYWDATSLRIKLARPVINSVLWDIFPNNAGPALNAGSGRLSAASLINGGVGASYYNAVSGDLRLAMWNPATGAWTDELVDGAAADVGQISSLQVNHTDGAPVVAYLAPGAVRLATKLGNVWQSQDVPGTEGQTVTGLALELALGSRERARLSYTTSSGGVYVANLRNGTWQTEVVATNGAAVQSGLSAVQDSRLHLALARTGTGASYAFRTANLDLDDDPTPPNEPPQQTDGGYNALDPCVEDHSSGNGLGAASAAHTAAAATAHTLAPAGGLDDGQIFGAMHTVFATTAAGQSYMDRYHEHGAEMAQIGLDDHDLLWDAYGTLQNFMPGLEALVTGRGSEVVVTQAMVDDALDIWQRLAAAGSPALAADINAELAQYNNLQDFVDMTFDEWAEAIGVQPPTLIFLPSVYR